MASIPSTISGEAADRASTQVASGAVDKWGDPLKYREDGVRLFQIYQRDHSWLDTFMTVITWPIFFYNATTLSWRAKEDPTYDPTVWKPRGP